MYLILSSITIIIYSFISIKRIKSEFNGVYKITSYSNNKYFKIYNNHLLLYYTNPSYFQFKKADDNSFLIEIVDYKRKWLGINKKNNIILYSKIKDLNQKEMTWKFIKLFENCYIIQNNFNLKLLQENDTYINFISRNLTQNLKNLNLFKKSLFNIIKVYEKTELLLKEINIIKKEPIDIVIKYIDLTDKSLKRSGIIQIYKDKDNEELRYSLRSIFSYIPWVRKIFILMPNENVKFLKNKDEINYKIEYIKDKNLIGFDSANIQSFLFSLDKLENFGVSKNFIYMEDDYFVGASLKKENFFYYDKRKGKIYPNIITWGFYEINKKEVLDKYFYLYKKKDIINAHSKEGFLIQRLNTEKFFIDNYDFPLTGSIFTHNAIPENIDDLKEMFKIANRYIYMNETLYNRKRNVFSLCQQHYYNLYQLNVNHRKVKSIPSSYISIEKMKKQLNTALFVINTGGDHKPLTRHYRIQEKVMKKRFQIKTIYEKPEIKKKCIKKYFKSLIKIFIILKVLKIYYIII